MEKTKIYKITNGMGMDVIICGENIEEVIKKYDKLTEKQQNYEKEITFIEYIGSAYFGD